MHHPLLEVASVEVLAPAGVAAAIESAPSVAYAALVAPHGPWREELAAALEPVLAPWGMPVRELLAGHEPSEPGARASVIPLPRGPVKRLIVQSCAPEADAVRTASANAARAIGSCELLVVLPLPGCPAPTGQPAPHHQPLSPTTADGSSPRASVAAVIEGVLLALPGRHAGPHHGPPPAVVLVGPATRPSARAHLRARPLWRAGSQHPEQCQESRVVAARFSAIKHRAGLQVTIGMSSWPARAGGLRSRWAAGRRRRPGSCSWSIPALRQTRHRCLIGGNHLRHRWRERQDGGWNAHDEDRYVRRGFVCRATGPRPWVYAKIK
jgi:hypothetical protein